MIPASDLQAQHRALEVELVEAARRVITGAQFILGAEVEAFEREFAAYCGASFAVAVNSGTSALHLALLAAGVGPGDEAITTPYTFVATIAAIGYTGARPRFVDIDPGTLNLDPAGLERALTARTKAVIPVHLFGQPADMEPIRRFARAHNLVVIEDAAQAHGAEYRGRRAGSLGDAGCFSFYPTKNLGACGEGGIVTTSNPEYARTIRSLRDWGQDAKYHHVVKGFNYRMEGLQGALLRVKLPYLEQWTEARRDIAACYDRLLKVERQRVLEGVRHVYHVYSIRSPRRDELRAALEEGGIETRIHYPTPLHLMPAWSELGYKSGDFPEAERLSREQLSLPIYPELGPERLEQIYRVCRVALDSSRD
ncbi:MAG: DegT/DnrJ/EryC1/StrS family aminotransferase [Bryobacteraceae bacterium]